MISEQKKARKKQLTLIPRTKGKNSHNCKENRRGKQEAFEKKKTWQTIEKTKVTELKVNYY
jgi:hypothetical protein